MESEANLTKAYRQCRLDFIAACEKAGADVIGRVHPAKGPDGKPLFCDSAAFGPRDAARALLLIAGADGLVTVLLARGLVLPKAARLVVVHALDPFACAWGRPGQPRDWPDKTLADIAAEDLSRAKDLVAVDMEDGTAKTALAAALPRTAIFYRTVTMLEAEAFIAAAIAAL